MASKYFAKAGFINFFKRFTKNELPIKLNFGKQNGEHNKIIQRRESFWHQIGLKYYYTQLQATMGKLVGGFETRLSELGRNMPTTGRRSLRQAKRNILQLVVDSKKRIRQLEMEIGRIRNMLPYGESTNSKFSSSQRQSTYSASMMEEGKIGESRNALRLTEATQSLPPSKELLLQYDRDTTFANEPCYKGRITSSKFPQTYTSCRNSAMSSTSNTVANKIYLSRENDTTKLDSAISLRTPDSDVPRALMAPAKD